jgi:hypothetical protein
LEGVAGDKLGAGLECFSNIPRDEITLSESFLPVDEDGNLSIRTSIMPESFMVSLCEPGLLLGQARFLKGEGDLLLKQDKPDSLGKGTDAICDESDGFCHGSDV